MRGLGFFFGGTSKRNQRLLLEDPHPVTDYGTKDEESGNAGLDGFTVLSKANPNDQGNPPPVKGVVRPIYSGPDMAFD
jgi:hypothetical protein